MQRANTRLSKSILHFCRKTHIDKPIWYIYVFGWQRIFPGKEMKEERLFFAEKNDEIKNITDKLYDERSKEVYRAVLRHRAYRDVDLRRFIGPNDQYFPNDILRLSNEEVFVDCGAFDGDTIQSFLSHVTKYKQIVAIEPDGKNFGRLSCFVSDNNIGNCKLFKLGTSSQSGEMYLEAELGKPSSTLTQEGEISISVDTLDNILAGESSVTFVKMDIEGAETETIKGAWNIIENKRPILAICIYHSKEDLINIPIMLMNRLKDYRFYIRHYTVDWSESVIYAIPEERF